MKFISFTDPEFSKYLPEFLKQIASSVDYTPEELKQIYAAYKEQFTAADLQEYTEPIEAPVFLDDLIKELEEIQKNSFEAKRG